MAADDKKPPSKKVAAVRPQTWDEDPEDVVHSIAHWMLVESVIANHSWTSLNASSGLVLTGMEVAQKVAAYRGIHPGYVMVTADDLLAALKAAAVEHNAPAARMPIGDEPVPSEEPPAAA